MLMLYLLCCKYLCLRLHGNYDVSYTSSKYKDFEQKNLRLLEGNNYGATQ